MLADHAAPILETRRLRLAPLGRAHAALYPLSADRAVAWNLAAVPWPQPREAFLAYLAHCEAGEGEADNFAVLHKGAPIGIAGIKRPGTGEPPRTMPRLGYWIGRPYWGEGFATEAVAAIVGYAFSAFGAERVGAGVFIDNPASRRVLEKLGFAEVQRYPTHSVARGVAVGTVDMQVARGQWLAGAGGRS